MEDVLFMLKARLVEFATLEQYFAAVLPKAPRADIDPAEFVAYFAEVKKRYLGS